MSNQNKSKMHYAWVIVFSCFLIMCFALCLVMNCFGLFVKPVTEDLGISRQTFSLVSTVVSLSTMVGVVFAGKIFGRFGLKKVMVLCCLGLSISYSCYSFASNMAMFYGISVLVGLFMSLIAQVPCSMLVTNWFNDKRGVALGMVFMGTGIGGVFLNPLISFLMTNYGWRKTYLVLGVLMFVTLIPTTTLLIKENPADMGLEPLGGVAVSSANVGEMQGVTLAEARKDSRFYLLLLIACLTVMSCYGMMQHFPSYMNDVGYSYEMAANIGAINLGILAVGKLILGRIFDKTGPVKGSYLSVACIVAAALALTMAGGSLVMLGAYLLLFALGCAFTTVAFPILTTHLFGQKDYGSIYSLVSVAVSVGTAIGAPAVATIYDKTGSYVYAWYLCAVLTALSFLLLIATFSFAKSKQKV